MGKKEFSNYFEKTDSCWNFKGAVNSSGYGSLYLDGRKIGAHCAAYIMAHGPYDKSLFVLHSCDNPRCMNPEHLFLGTQTDNMQDCVKKGRNTKAYRWTKENNPNAGKPMSEQMRRAVSGWKQRPFSLTAPDGSVIHGVNLTQFCKDNGLNQGGAWSVMNGNIRSHKGYTKAP
jgi:hypothetical protein